MHTKNKTYEKNTEKSIQCLCLLILFCLAISAEAQVKKNITGRVIDALGAPIVGAAIQEKEHQMELHPIWMVRSFCLLKMKIRF